MVDRRVRSRIAHTALDLSRIADRFRIGPIEFSLPSRTRGGTPEIVSIEVADLSELAEFVLALVDEDKTEAVA
jgi:hypothetical protein